MYVCVREKSGSDVMSNAIDMNGAIVRTVVSSYQKGTIKIIISNRENEIRWNSTLLGNLEDAGKKWIEDNIDLEPEETPDSVYQELIKRDLYNAIADAFTEYIIVDAPDNCGLLYIDDIFDHVLEIAIESVYDEMMEEESEKEDV